MSRTNFYFERDFPIQNLSGIIAHSPCEGPSEAL